MPAGNNFGDRPEEALASGAAGQAAFADLGRGECLANNRPRTAVAALWEARTAAASTAAGAGARGGEARAAAVASMEASGAAATRRQWTSPLHPTRMAGERVQRGCWIWSWWLERTSGEGDQAAGGSRSPRVAMVARGFSGVTFIRPRAYIEQPFHKY